MAERAERIGPTAHYTAYVWRRAGFAHARHFSTRRGAVYYWGFWALGEWMMRLRGTTPSMAEVLEHRHRLIDAVVEREQPGVVVELGAGLTRRAVMWAADRGVPAIEIDLPMMVGLKRRHLASAPAALRARLAARHVIHAGDLLAPGFDQRLAQWLGGHTRPVVVVEGVLGYFDDEARRAAIAAVASGLRWAGGGTMVSSLHLAADQARASWSTRVRRAATKALTRRSSAMEPFADWATLHDGFTSAGFGTCVRVEPATHADLEPRLMRLRSFGTVVVARIEPPPS
ncbi:MAG: class I SAM-dependent methyltransferase [Deltaproteobacteria bacterium]|nr:class I SAM-dependent methyltransferase [Deltaproteobacteria bacterium]